ncbi:MAG: carboxypeptidase Q [Candidatus Azotimanducaceae bacterium]|jgi:carboxypeptidase Q
MLACRQRCVLLSAMLFARSLVLLAVSAPLLAQVTPEQFAIIKKQGLEDSQVMAHLDHLVNRIGPRLTGSDNLTVAGEWAVDKFKSFGIENARLEKWGDYAVGFNRGPWWGRMTKPVAMEFVCNTNAWTAGTKGPARGLVVAAPKDDDELAAMKGKLHHTWMLNPDGRMLAKLTVAMEAEGGFGFVTGRSGRSGELLLTGGRPSRDMDSLPNLPVVRLKNDSYEAVVEHLEAGEEVEVEFDIRNHFRKGPIPLYNVVADIIGTEFPDQFVVVGGHLDSWDGATGTTDNGTGSATTLEAARLLMALDAKPRRSIRFMLWSGEEQGLLGSRAWVQEHKDEMSNYSASLVHDGGTNYLSGIAGMPEMRPQLEIAFEHVLTLSEELPFSIREIPAFTPIGSDHEAFTAVGVPGFFWNQAGRANYTYTHHTQHDTYGAAIPEYQRHSSVVAATGAWGLANLPELLTRENMKVRRGFSGGARSSRRMLGVQLGEDGVTIGSVTEDSVAAKAGLKAGDTILKIGDTAIKSQRDLRRAMAGGAKKKSLMFSRGGKQQTVEVSFPR